MSPLPKQTQGPNGLVLGFIIVSSLFALSILAQAPRWATTLVISVTIFALCLYLRTLRTSLKARYQGRVNKKAGRLRADVLEGIVDALPRAIAVLDQSATVLHANAAAQAMLSPNMVGHPVSAYLQTSLLNPQMELAFAGGTPSPFSVHIKQPTERYLDVDFSEAISIKRGRSQIDVVIAVLADRTQAAKERELRADFLANASHELKTPIASLKGYIETLRGHAKDDAVAREKFLGIMAEQADRMERLVTDLLSLRRIESSEHIAPSETADIRKAIEAARNSLDLLAESRRVNLVVSLPEAPTYHTSGKTDECIQLFLNLMGNAIKLSPIGSTVTTRLEKLPNWSGEAFPPPLPANAGFRSIVNLSASEAPVWRAIITDEGPGLSSTHLPRICERFYRVAGDLPAQEKGTGLGLAIVKHIVLRHRAGLFVQTVHAGDVENVQTGTSFSVVFTSTDHVR